MAEIDPRLSHQTLRALNVFIDQPMGIELSGSDVCRETKMLSGTVYPILMRLEKAGWLRSEWEKVNASEEGRPRKRLYQITGIGYNKARAALAELGVPNGRLAWKR